MNQRFGFHEVVDAFHGGFRFLHEGGDPTDRRKGPRQQVDVKDKLEDVPDFQLTGDDPLATDVDGQNGAQTDKQDNDWHEQRLRLHEVQCTRFVAIGFFRKTRGCVVFPLE